MLDFLRRIPELLHLKRKPRLEVVGTPRDAMRAAAKPTPKKAASRAAQRSGPKPKGSGPRRKGKK